MKTIEIRLPELGKATGTTAWVTPLLVKINESLQLSETGSKLPCLSYEHPFHTDKDGKKKRYILVVAVKDNYDESLMFFDTYLKDYGVLTSYPIDTDTQNGIFNYLTYKAECIIQEYITKVAKNFAQSLSDN